MKGQRAYKNHVRKTKHCEHRIFHLVISMVNTAYKNFNILPCHKTKSKKMKPIKKEINRDRNKHQHRP